jgi:hypothetical protein
VSVTCERFAGGQRTHATPARTRRTRTRRTHARDARTHATRAHARTHARKQPARTHVTYARIAHAGNVRTQRTRTHVTYARNAHARNAHNHATHARASVHASYASDQVGMPNVHHDVGPDLLAWMTLALRITAVKLEPCQNWVGRNGCTSGGKFTSRSRRCQDRFSRRVPVQTSSGGSGRRCTLVLMSMAGWYHDCLGQSGIRRRAGALDIRSFLTTAAMSSTGGVMRCKG